MADSEQDQMMETADMGNSRMADDFLVGWDVKGASEREYLGDIGAKRFGPSADIDEAYRYSLLRGLDEFEMMMGCAEALRDQQELSQSPLDGKDPLTFLSMITGHSPWPSRDDRLSKRKRAHESLKEPQQSKAKKPKKKKHKANESHFFGGGVVKEKADRGPKKKKKKNRSRKDKRQKARSEAPVEDGTYSAPERPLIPVLKEASTFYQSSGNVPRAQGSVSGDGILSNDKQQSQASYEVENSQNTPPPSPSSPNKSGIMSETRGLGETAKAQITQVVGANLISNPTEQKRYTLRPSSPTLKRVSKSHYFSTPQPTPTKPKIPRRPGGIVSSLPFPPLSVPQFGLIQEKLANDPFRLLIAITFLVKTHGKTAIPTFNELIEKYSNPEALASASAHEMSAMIRHLGLSVVRTAQIQKYARVWLERPPSGDMRYGVKNYPKKGDGSDVRAEEEIQPEVQDPRTSAWEIGHMTQGPYAIDSCRIFCRDVLLGRAEDFKGKGREGEFQPEWMRVLPLDKELRACLRWMWMQEGWNWDPVTGEREVLTEELRSAVDEGRVEWDNTGQY